MYSYQGGAAHHKPVNLCKEHKPTPSSCGRLGRAFPCMQSGTVPIVRRGAAGHCSKKRVRRADPRQCVLFEKEGPCPEKMNMELRCAITKRWAPATTVSSTSTTPQPVRSLQRNRVYSCTLLVVRPYLLNLVFDMFECRFPTYMVLESGPIHQRF
jgi:hypothetical protein